MNLYTIDTGYFKLDGGAMFGIVPKAIWQKINPADGNNLCTWAMRCLLIEQGDRLILIDTGLGDKQNEKFFSHFEPHGDDSMVKSLAKHGFTPDDVTDVILTHLHFDHCGGAVVRNAAGRLEPLFQKAVYWSDKRHWQWASEPNARERVSFLQENFKPLEASGQVQFAGDGQSIAEGVQVKTVFGHTEAMYLVYIDYKETTLVYMADLIPSSGHLRLPYIMAYDVRPLVTLEEKTRFLQEAFERDYILFFEHDREVACCNLHKTDKGIMLDKALRLEDLV